jgi:WhiB family redox-sensing transcriptional regulator
MDPAIFFLARRDGGDPRKIERAKSVCRVCPVREECLAYADECGEKAGIWGGLTGDERRRRKRPLRPPTMSCRWCSATFATDGARAYCSEGCAVAGRRERNARRQRVRVGDRERKRVEVGA